MIFWHTPPEMMNKMVTVAAQSNKGPESYPEPEEDYEDVKVLGDEN